MNAIEKYLAAHAEPEASLAPRLCVRFAERLVVPAYAEGEGVLGVLESVPASPRGPVLVVLVENLRVDARQEEVQRAARSEAAVQRVFAEVGALADHVRVHDHPAGALVRIDRRGRRALPADQGVGLARKIGLDFALAQAASQGRLSAWLHSSDADATLPGDYFDAPGLAPSVVAAIHPFTHRAVPEVGDAIFAYEAHLRLLVLGLAAAGSPFAYHAIGSTLAVRARAYAEVRGMPRRQAAEDFHFLNKLRKRGPIARLEGHPIVLSGRRSTRVPFGTGRAMLASESAARTYDPRIFMELRRGLEALRESETPAELRARLDGALGAAMLAEKADQTLLAAAAHPPAHRARHLRAGFDALRTLRVMHRLRDGGLVRVPVRDAIARTPWVDLDPQLPFERLCAELARLERVPSPSPRAPAVRACPSAARDARAPGADSPRALSSEARACTRRSTRPCSSSRRDSASAEGEAVSGRASEVAAATAPRTPEPVSQATPSCRRTRSSG